MARPEFEPPECPTSVLKARVVFDVVVGGGAWPQALEAGLGAAALAVEREASAVQARGNERQGMEGGEKRDQAGRCGRSARTSLRVWAHNVQGEWGEQKSTSSFYPKALTKAPLVL